MCKQRMIEISPCRSLLPEQIPPPPGRREHPSWSRTRKFGLSLFCGCPVMWTPLAPAERHNGSWSSERPLEERYARQLSEDSYPRNDRRTQRIAADLKGRLQPGRPAMTRRSRRRSQKPTDDERAGFNGKRATWTAHRRPAHQQLKSTTPGRVSLRGGLKGKAPDGTTVDSKQMIHRVPKSCQEHLTFVD
jgi:hypothetical protein